MTVWEEWTGGVVSLETVNPSCSGIVWCGWLPTLMPVRGRERFSRLPAARRPHPFQRVSLAFGNGPGGGGRTPLPIPATTVVPPRRQRSTCRHATSWSAWLNRKVAVVRRLCLTPTNSYGSMHWPVIRTYWVSAPTIKSATRLVREGYDVRRKLIADYCS